MELESTRIIIMRIWIAPLEYRLRLLFVSVCERVFLKLIMHKTCGAIIHQSASSF